MKTPGRIQLEKLIGKTVTFVSHSDRHESRLATYLMFDDGTVLRYGIDGFKVFSAEEYANRQEAA